MLLALGWALYIAVRIRGEIALPASLAEYARANPHATTIIATLVATCLSGFSLIRPRPEAILSALVIPPDFPGSAPRHSGHFYTDGGVQSPGHQVDRSFAPFLHSGGRADYWVVHAFYPIPIVLTTPLVGTELDFTNDVFLQYSKSGLFDEFLESDLFSQVAVDVTESGFAAAQEAIGYPAAFDFNYRTYNVSTGGILPAYLESVRSSAGRLGNETIPTVTHSVKPLPRHAISTNYTMVHQGPTANVSCAVAPLSALPMSTNITAVDVPGATIYSWEAWMDPECSSPWNTFWMFNTGLYSYMSAVSCTVFPKITTVSADYTSEGNIDTELIAAETSSDPPAEFSFSTIMDMFSVSQGVSTHVVGNQISAVLRTLPSSNWTDADLIQREAYFRGVIEFSGSLLRTCLSETVTPFADGIPANITRPTSGVFRTETLSWSFATAPTRVILLPTTLLALASITVIVDAWVQNPGQMHRRFDFDATNPLHLMAAAAAGGLGDTFKGLAWFARDPRWGENGSRAGDGARAPDRVYACASRIDSDMGHRI
ncbi:hypothetical protein DFH06DRAFT_1344854 [Mycena polygramma]|nr:hypothetical protein DFH06DRAFT_1344854 [Mycena polygramma]